MAKLTESHPVILELAKALGRWQAKDDFAMEMLHTRLDGEEIIVTKPGTEFMLAYRKMPDRPNLVLTRSWLTPSVMSPEVSEFRAHAFQAAVNKARELGWIA